MGAPPAEFGRALVNADQVQVTLTHPFWIGRTEVGLYEVHGNVSELVNDLYSPSGYLSGPYGAGAEPLIDPPGTMTRPEDITKTVQQDSRIARGGTHSFLAVKANASRRSSVSD